MLFLAVNKLNIYNTFIFFYLFLYSFCNFLNSKIAYKTSNDDG